MLEDRLTEHLNAVDDEAQERMDILVRQMMEKEGIFMALLFQNVLLEMQKWTIHSHHELKTL